MIKRLEKDFKETISVIKEEIKNIQYKVAVQNNISLILLYFRLGKILNDNYKYGNKFIDEVSRNLKYMKRFYLKYKDDEKVQQHVAQLP